MTRTALLLAVLTASLLVAAEEEPKPLSDSLKERWKLRLLPEKAPQIASLLAGTVWENKEDLSGRLGQGVEYALRFEVPEDTVLGLSEPWVEFTTIRKELGNGLDGGPGSSSLERKTTVVDYATWTRTETARTYKLVIDRSFLEFNGLVHTAVVIKDKQLILDACIPVEAGKWYRLSSWRGSDGVVSVTEYLFEFQDDPLQKQEGKLIAHIHRRSTRKGDSENHVRVPATFKFTQRFGDGQWFTLKGELVNGARYRLPEAFFQSGRDYIGLGPNNDGAAKVYEAKKIK